MPTATEAALERRLAVLGSPIAHSKSPMLHAAAYRALGLRWRYEAIRVESPELAGFVGSRNADWHGLSLTMPLKYAVLPLVDSLDAVARITGAANTILFETDASGARMRRGFNTDVAGIVRALRAAGVGGAQHVHVFGGGATAASAVAAAAELGAEHVSVAVRTPSRAQSLKALARSVGLSASIDTFDQEQSVVPDLVVSTLPGSITAADARTIVDGRAMVAAADAGAAFFDVAYDPWPSHAVQAWRSLTGGEQPAAASHGVVLSGLAMLVHQALLQVRIFVAGDPSLPLNNEAAVLAAMLESVGLDAAGSPVDSTVASATGGEQPARMPES